MADQSQLAPEDYAQLHAMLLSEDAATRTQGQALAKKLTPDEQQQFFAVQQQANAGKGERTREDASVLGMPPEAVAAAAIPVAGAVINAGGSLAAKTGAGVTAALGQAAPLVKYEATKSLLQFLHVPTPLAVAAAIGVSGYKAGAPAAAVEAAPTVVAPTAAATVATAAKPHYTAMDVLNAQKLMKAGVPQADALATIAKLKVSSLGAFLGNR